MRAFNNREKDIIRKLVNLRHEYGGNMTEFLSMYVYGPDSGTAIVLNPDAVSLTWSMGDFDERVDNQREEIERFYELLALLVYLRDERFITIFGLPDADDDDGTCVIGTRPPEGNPCRTAGLGAPCHAAAKETMLGEVYISEDLRELVRDNFVTREQMRFARQYRLTWAALVVAIAVGATGIVLQTIMMFNSL